MSRHAEGELLSLYLDDQVEDDDARWLRQHLLECGDCRARLEGLRRVVDGLRGLETATPPSSLGIELQRQLARATPPFADRDAMGRRAPRQVMQPAVLGSLGVVLALAVIMLLFLQALQTRSDGGAAGRFGERELAGEAKVIVGERVFRSSTSGWVEAALTPTEIQRARVVERDRLLEEAPEELRRVLEQLAGELTLEHDGEVVRVVD